MGKSNNKERSSAEHYKSIIRQLKKQIKQLHQQLNKLNNNIGIPDSNGNEVESEQFETCKQCGKGIIQELIIANRIIRKCSLCDFRSRATKIDKDKP